MFDIGAPELLVIAVIAIVVIGPKDLPLALRTAGRWVSKGRQLMSQFRASLDTIAHEAEMEDMEKRWAEQNARIMREHGDGTPMLPLDGLASYGPGSSGDDSNSKDGNKPNADAQSDTAASPESLSSDSTGADDFKADKR